MFLGTSPTGQIRRAMGVCEIQDIDHFLNKKKKIWNQVASLKRVDVYYEYWFIRKNFRENYYLNTRQNQIISH